MYDQGFFSDIANGAARSAGVVVPLVDRGYEPVTVVDVGCGQGWWGAAFEARGCAVTGVDGDYVTDRQLARFVEHDLTQPLPDLARFDLAVCLEVAEHLPESRAASFVADLVALAPVVLFSAAIPGQPGVHHVNCQWPAYWAEKFAEHGYGVRDTYRWPLWDDDRVEPWYRQNLMVFESGREIATPRPLVHPFYWDMRR